MTTAPKQWRQWMPLDVDDFLTSEDLLMMSPEAFKGYFTLILQQWRSDDGYLPLDEEVMQKRSRLTPEQWQGAKAAIMAKFGRTDLGYSNPRCRAELDKVLEQYEKRSAGAKATNEKRWGVKPSLSDQRAIPERSLSVAPNLLSSTLLSSPSQSESLSQDSGKAEELDGGKDRKGKSSLLADVKGDLAENTQHCDLSGNAPHVPENTPQSGDSGDTGVPADSQQPVVGAPTKPKNAPGRTSDGYEELWPVTGPPFDQAIADLVKAHPRPLGGELAYSLAQRRISELRYERKCSAWDAYTYLLGRVMSYKTATDAWPESEKRFIAKFVNWMQEEGYKDDDAMWNRNTGQSRFIPTAELVQKDGQEGSAGDGDGRLIDMPGPEELARLRAAIRGTSRGPSRALVGFGTR